MNPTHQASDRVALFRAIETEVAWLQAKWLVFRRLYATDDRTVDLLNRSAPWFFTVIHQVMLDDLALSLTRLTEPSMVAGKETLVLDRILAECESSASPEVVEELARLVASAKKHSATLRPARNQRIAHTDLKATIHGSLTALPTTSRTEIEAALQDIFAALNLAAPHLGSATTDYELTSEFASTESLLACLKEADEGRSLGSTRHRIQGDRPGSEPPQPAV
jgi:hypothetical protein